MDHDLFHQWFSLCLGHGLRPLPFRPRLRATTPGLRQQLCSANGLRGDGATHQPRWDHHGGEFLFRVPLQCTGDCSDRSGAWYIVSAHFCGVDVFGESL